MQWETITVCMDMNTDSRYSENKVCIAFIFCILLHFTYAIVRSPEAYIAPTKKPLCRLRWHEPCTQCMG